MKVTLPSLTQINVNVPEMAVVTQVVSEIANEAPDVPLSSILLVGARCRDLWSARTRRPTHSMVATTDLDLALAVNSWEPHTHLTEKFHRTGSSNGIQYLIAGLPVDVMPFGDVEDPTGTVTPPARGDQGFSVWAFQEVFEASVPLEVPGVGTVRIASIPGYVTLKLCAWLDRSPNCEYKDARDVEAAIHWFDDVELDELLHDQGLMAQHDFESILASTHLLGTAVADLLGPERVRELLDRWTDATTAEIATHMRGPVATIRATPEQLVKALLQGIRRL